MRENFSTCLEMVLKHEGGYVNHPHDPEGMTNLGITKKTYDNFYGTDADEDDMRAITVKDVRPIYKQEYWDRCKCDDLPSGVDWAVFDWAVNSGTSRAIKALQKAVGTLEDGIIGEFTLGAVRQSQPSEVINRIAIYRDSFYRSLNHFDTFGKGWIRRNDETRETALNMGLGT